MTAAQRAPESRGTSAPHGRLRRFADGALALCFPPACAICHVLHTPGVDGIVCDVCLARLVPLPHPQCSRCGHPRLSLNTPGPAGPSATGAPPVLSPCRWCPRLPAFVRSVRSVCRMDEGTGASLVHALKYAGWPAVALPMGRRMGRLSFPDDVREERTALVPLPLAGTRLRERGYNQSERLADALAPLWNVPVWSDTIARVRETRSQVRLTPSERATNVSRAFAVRMEVRPRLRGAHVMLVDDVITTAATLNAAALALLDGGARIVSYVTFGRAPDPGDRAVPDLDLDSD